MKIMAHPFKRIVTAFLFGVWISLPAQVSAQDAALDDLFEQLAQADESTHAQIARDIYSAWEKSGSPAIDLLLRRAREAMEADSPEIAVEHYTAMIDHAPDFAEGYHGRASAFYALDMMGPALDDLAQVLILEPRQFDAMFGIGVILEAIERPKDAMEVYRTILALYPLEEKARAAVDRLQLELEGQAT